MSAGGKHSDEYRVVDYDGRWYAEVQSSQGVWQILGNYDTKEEAEEIIKRKEEDEVKE